MTNDMNIRPAKDPDRDTIWEIFHEVIAAGDTYPIDPEMCREDAFAYWCQTGARAFVAERDGHIVGIYTLHSNQSGGRAHGARAAFMVPAVVRRHGSGR